MEESDSRIVIITGPESTGKTSISQFLVEHYQAGFIEEYARSYIGNLTRPYLYDDIEHIANWQKKAIIDARKQKGIWIADTYLIITKVWLQWIAGKYPSWIDKEISQTTDCLYILCAPDIEWLPDPLRENGGENRIKLFNAYQKELEQFGLKYQIVTGTGNQRFLNALNFADQYLCIK